MSRSEPPGRPSGSMGQKPRVPVGPRRNSAGPAEPPRPTDANADGAADAADTWRDRDPTRPGGPGTRASAGPGPRRTESTRPGRPSARPPSRSSAPPPPRRPQRRRVWLWAACILLGLLALGAGTVAGLFEYYGRDLPDVSQLRTSWHPPQTTRILARDNSLIAELFIERRTIVPMTDIPPNLVKAVLAAEDAHFYEHHGLNYLGMMRAVLVDIRRGTTAQGASTITQQVVKNVLLTPERTLARKVREAILAQRIEQELSKNEILHLYLNHIAFGHGRNGVEEAALFYFGKHVRELSLGECALLAGIPKNPTGYSPRLNPEAARHRRHWVLGQMVSNRFVTQQEAEAADAEPIRLVDPSEDEGIAPEVVEAARTLLRQTVGEDALRSGGYTIVTTIDPDLERAARAAVQSGLRDLDTRQGYFGPLLAAGARPARGRPGYVLPGDPPPRNGTLVPGRVYAGTVESVVDPEPSTRTPGAIYVRVGAVRGMIPWNSVARYVRADTAPSTFAPRGATVRVSVDRPATADVQVPMRLELGPQGALVALDPRTREVLALVGGYDAIAGMFDRASRAMRQAGSSFKPFLYSYALTSRRYTLASTIDPNPACFDRWCPRDAHAHREGEPPEAPIRLRDALAYSRNIVAARVVIDLGPQALADHATQLGIHSPLNPLPSLALGTSDVTPMDMTNAYASWDAQGTYQPPVLISHVYGPNHAEIRLPGREPSRQAVSPEVAYLVTSMMQSVVDHGTGVRARALHRPVAGKTGTSNEARDAWFLGYSPDLVAGVWVGFDDRQPLGRGEEGARSALPIWTQFMQNYVRQRHPPAVDFPRPAGVAVARIDPATGLLARPEQPDALEEYFLPGTQPNQIALPPADAGGSNFFTQVVAGDGGITVEVPEEPQGDTGDGGAANGANGANDVDDAGAPSGSHPGDGGAAAPAVEDEEGEPPAPPPPGAVVPAEPSGVVPVQPET